MNISSNDFPSYHPTSLRCIDFEIPFFEEAFDTESLKKFYRKKDSSPISQQEFSIEEETRSHTQEPFSPSTTSLSYGPYDYSQHPGKETMTEMFVKSNLSSSQTSQNSFVTQSMGQRKAQESNENRFSVNLFANDQSQEVKEDQQSKELIGKLLQEMQNYYKLPLDNTVTTTNTKKQFEEQKVRGNTQRSINKSMSEVLDEERSIKDGVLRKLIKKKRVFIIQRKKPLANQLTFPKKNFNQTQIKPQKKTIDIQLLTQSLSNNQSSSQICYFGDNLNLLNNQKENEKNIKVPGLPRNHINAGQFELYNLKKFENQNQTPENSHLANIKSAVPYQINYLS